MSVDLITSVLGAVDQKLAAARFTQKTGAPTSNPVQTANFADVVRKFTGKNVQAGEKSDSLASPAQLASSKVPSSDAKTKAMLGLEGTLMNKMVDSMMPQDSDKSIYGSGLAGDTWRSFAVEQMGQAVAKSDLLHFGSRTTTSSVPHQSFSLFSQLPLGQAPNWKITPFAGSNVTAGDPS